MNSIQNLWYGNLRPAEEPATNDKTCSSLRKQIYDEIDKLEGLLNEEGKSLLNRKQKNNKKQARLFTNDSGYVILKSNKL